MVINNHSEDDVKLFHAGTKIQDNQLVTSGGRVFCATGTGADLATAQKNAYNLVSKISFEGAVNRPDSMAASDKFKVCDFFLKYR